MDRRIALLRGINVGGHRRVSMPELRELLAGAGYADVRTYVQSGNVVLSSAESPGALRGSLERLIADGLGVEVEIVVRTAGELAGVVERDPFGDLADNPKRYQVAFLAAEPDKERAAALSDMCAGGERVVVSGREIYCWHPDGVQNSKLARAVAGGRLGTTVTARNWNTVLKLLEMAGE